MQLPSFYTNCQMQDTTPPTRMVHTMPIYLLRHAFWHWQRLWLLNSNVLQRLRCLASIVRRVGNVLPAWCIILFCSHRAFGIYIHTEGCAQLHQET